MTFFLNENLIFWQFHKQQTVTLFFCEVKFMAATPEVSPAILDAHSRNTRDIHEVHFRDQGTD